MNQHAHSRQSMSRFAVQARGEGGFGLVDALVAVGLLGIALMPLAYIQSSGARNGFASYEMVAASALAFDLVDRISTIPYQDPRLAPTDGYVVPDATLSNANPLAADGTNWTSCGPWTLGSTPKCGFARTIKVTANTPLANAKRVDVQVNWSEYGINRKFILSTIKAVGS
jgi:Tfp pilus assembly protein PilV